MYTVEFGTDIRSIGDFAFADCSSLREIVLGSKVESIGEGAFNGCSNIKTLITSPALKTIGKDAFRGVNLTTAVLGCQVSTIESGAFAGNSRLTDLYSANPNPPAAEEDCFEQYGANLWVQTAEDKTRYIDSDYCWYRFEDNFKIMNCAESLTVDLDNLTYEPDTQVQLTATLLPSDVTLPYVFWESSNTRVATVDRNGLVTFQKVETGNQGEMVPMQCVIKASTLYGGGPEAVITVGGTPEDGIDTVVSDEAARSSDIYTLQGTLVKRNATREDVKTLVPGIYIMGGKKILVK